MKKNTLAKTVALFLSLVMLVCFVSCSKEKAPEVTDTQGEFLEIPAERIAPETLTPASSFAGGDGTEDSPYEISNAAELAYFASLFFDNASVEDADKYQTAYYILTDEIEVNSVEEMSEASFKAPKYGWRAIGDQSESKSRMYFGGVFDGNGHVISGLYTCTLGAGYGKEDSLVGLFGDVREATIKNLTVANSYFYVYNSASGVGAIAASPFNSSFINCHTRNVHLHLGSGAVGGIVGSPIGWIEMEDCSSDGTVEGAANSYVGGISASISDGIIENCVNNAAVIGVNDAQAGGICGRIGDSAESNSWDQEGTPKGYGKTSLINCINRGEVESITQSGGISAVALSGNSSILIKGCSNYAKISGTENIAGIIGMLTVSDNYVDDKAENIGSVEIEDCSNDGEISGKRIAGILGLVKLESGSELSVKGCENSGTVNGTDFCAGINAFCAVTEGSVASFSNCSNLGDITCDSMVGGIVAQFNSPDAFTFTIDDSVNEGTLTCKNLVGGILAQKVSDGDSNDTFRIRNCANKGEIDVEMDAGQIQFAGGIVADAGTLFNSEIKTIVNCVNSGRIKVSVVGGDENKEDAATEEDTSKEDTTEEAEEKTEEAGNDSKVYNYVGGIVATASSDVIIRDCAQSGSFIVVSGDESSVAYNDQCALVVEPKE